MAAPYDGPYLGALLKCRFCGALFSPWPPAGEVRHDMAPRGCPADAAAPPLHCFACRCQVAAEFSATQISRFESGVPARCQACVASGRVELAELPATPTLNQRLTESVADAHVPVADVEALLLDGADPNYTRQAALPVVYAMGIPWRARGLWRPDGTEWPEDDPEHCQPTTPLKLVVFRISDCMLGDAELRRFRAVAEVLIAAGADRAPAVAHAEGRYGEFIPAIDVDAQGPNLFTEVLAVVHGHRL
jgi:hypothetical protein